MVLSAEATRKLFTPQSRGYAYGWGVRQSPAGTEIGHDGGNTNGVAADMRFLPDSNIVLISFANDDGESTLLGAVRSRLRQLALGVRIEMPPQPVASSALVARIPGPYELPGGDHIHAVVNGGRVEMRPQGQVATNLLWSGEPGDVGKWRDVGARTRQVVEAGLRGDSAALRRMLPQRRRLPMILDGWRRDLEARFGAFKECVVLGSRPGGAGAPEESPTEVRMHFERGSADAVFVWVPDDLAGFALMPQRAVVFAPVSETELASYDFATGRLRRAQFDGGALVIGGVRARQAGSSQSGSAATGRGALRPGTYAVRNVSIVPMTKDTVLARHAVLVRDGRIAWIGPSSALRAPRGTRIIDGANGFLLPGLADMHTHLFSDGEEVHDSAGPAELGVMVANGVTTARFMIGTPEQLVLRKAVASGDVVGPQMWVGSPQLTGRASENAIVVTNDTEARAAVRRAAADRYDFIKLTLFITRPVYDAVVDEARRVRIKVAGHVEPAVGVARALETGQQLEHLDAYLEAVLADSAPSKASLTQGGVFAMRNWPSLDYIDNRKVDSIAGATARAGAYIDPTQHVFNTAFAIGESVEAIRARPDFALWPPRLRDGYLRAHSRYWAPANDTIKTTARRARYVDVRNRLVKAIHDSGGKIMAGSDSPEWFHAYGYGLHRELQALVAAGLSPYQALVAATRTPAEYLGASAEWGTLEVGKRADFVLVASNPLANVKNTESIRAVSVGGRWLTRPELDAMLARARRVIAPGT
jgi:imidazolonepropionase-like amidohydrolase